MENNRINGGYRVVSNTRELTEAELDTVSGGMNPPQNPATPPGVPIPYP